MLKLEKSDLGCGAGGGQNNVDVFRMAGLTFLTNANADDSNEAGIFPGFKCEIMDFLSWNILLRLRIHWNLKNTS